MSARPILILATGNPGKVRELQALLGDRWEVRPQSQYGVTPIPETGATFRANALLKAAHAAQITGLPALADDSGIEVDALGGRPGVLSARYAGEHATDADNNRRLLEELAGVPPIERGACYRCVLVMVSGPGDSQPIVAEGEWRGSIAESPRGSGGFGYDPLFIDADTGLRVAELPPETKNSRSHRAQALAALLARLRPHDAR